MMYYIDQLIGCSCRVLLLLFAGQLTSASSLTNLDNEPDYPPPRTRSASELLEHSSIASPARFRSRQRSRGLQRSLADSRSDYYNNRRPQSISLSSQIPAHSALHSTSSTSALGTISETNATHGLSSNAQFSTDSFFAEPPDTPLFHYNPTLSLTELATPTRTGSFRHSRLSRTCSNQAPVTAGAGHRQLNGANSNGYTEPPSAAAAPSMIHVSEPITAEFVPLYLNPVTGQMYSHNQDYFRPISSPNELLAAPPKPVRSQLQPPRSTSTLQIGSIRRAFFHCRTSGQRKNRHFNLHTSHSHRSWPSCFSCVEIL